ncbi:MAG: methyl-accepting chemotaxis protein [Myxococcales bacterium]
MRITTRTKMLSFLVAATLAVAGTAGAFSWLLGQVWETSERQAAEASQVSRRALDLIQTTNAAQNLLLRTIREKDLDLVDKLVSQGDAAWKEIDQEVARLGGDSAARRAVAELRAADAKVLDAFLHAELALANNTFLEEAAPAAERAMAVMETRLAEDLRALDARSGAERERSANLSRTFIGFAVALGLLLVGLGYGVTRSVVTPLRKMTEVARSLSRGEIDVEVDHHSGDEAGELADSFRETIGYIQEVSRGAAAIAAGDLSATLAPRSQADVLSQNFVQAIGTLRGLTDETQRLIAAAKAGDLGARGDPSKFKGAYAGIVGGVNEMLDAVIGPLGVAAEYVHQISKGAIPERITDAYRGDFNAIKDNLNTCIDAIHALVADADMLAAAAVEGRLDTRADAGRHQGDFRKIVEGVNQTLDSLVGFIDSMPLPAMVVGRDLRVRYMNKAGLGLGGTTLQQLKGQACSQYFKTSDCNTGRCACQRAIDTGVQAKSDTLARPRDGLALEIDYQGLPIKNRQGETVGAFEIVVDQTAIRRAQRQAQKLAEYQDVEVAKVQGALQQLASGDLRVQLAPERADEDTAQAHETFKTIDGAIAQVVTAVKALAADAGALSQAAIDGQLATRADASRHQGDFRTIVEGVNATLDSVLGPINVATEVLQRLAQQDLRARVTGDFQGDHAKIRDAVNQTASALHDALQAVAEAVDQVASASEQIAATSQAVSQGASEQASAIQETSSNMEEMLGITKQNADNTAQAKTLAQTAKASADKGSNAMERMAGSMKSVKKGAEGTAAIIADVSEIAFQTNLLALNAAVEAARAGDAGRGFAVVADEVRSLAQRAKEAAKKTEDLIKESVKLAGDGEALSKEVATDLAEIVNAVGKVTGIVAEISASSTEQSRGIDQINKAIGQMDKVTQQAASSAEESSSSAEELSGQAQSLAALVGRFQLQRKQTGPVRAAPKSPALPALGPARAGHGKANGRANGIGHAMNLKPEDVIPLESDPVFKDF